MGKQRKKSKIPINRNDIRNYTLYAIRLSNGKYYVGLTAYSDSMRRIRQHGGLKGARVNRGLKLEEVAEIRRIGKMRRYKAEELEVDMTNEYMDKYGKQNVRGGLTIKSGRVLLRSYAPGSNKWIIQTLWLTLVIFLIIVIYFFVISGA